MWFERVHGCLANESLIPLIRIILSERVPFIASTSVMESFLSILFKLFPPDQLRFLSLHLLHNWDLTLKMNLFS